MTKKEENLKGMSQVELEKKLADLRENVRVLRFKMEGSKPKNVKQFASLRKQVAKVLTEINRAKGQAGKKK
jgi:ribosomal protein L29